MIRVNRQLVIDTRHIKYGCVIMAIVLLMAAVGAGIWIHRQLDAPHRFWREAMGDLKSQSIIAMSWPGIELLGAEETKDEGFEPQPPRISNCYRLTISGEEARDLVLAAAVKDGWTEDSVVDSSYFRSGFKRLESRVIRLTISERKSDCNKYTEASFQITVYY